MTRINTNVASLVAQQRLTRSNNDLNLALQRLSTGLRINTGKDDPAGLIASEGLRSDITSINSAITNTQRANQVIATTDSALAQVSNLLNDIRGLATEAANSGALSAEQIAANQLQVDSSLEAINRISATTSFQGRKLLDGSLDFITNGGANFSQLSNLGIQQANLGTTGSLAVAINVTTAATQAQVNIANVPAAAAATNATANLTLTNAERQAQFTLTFDTTVASSIAITAVNGGAAEDADGNGITVVFTQDNTVAGGVNGAASNYNDGTNTLTIAADFASTTLTDTEVAAGIQAINGAGTTFTAVASPGGQNLAAADIGSYSTGSGIVYTVSGRDAGSHAFTVTADTAGAAANGVTVTIQESTSIPVNTVSAAINGSNNIVVDVNGTVTKAAIVSAINGLAGYSVTSTSATGDANYIDSADTPPGVATLAGGANASGGLAQDVVFELSGLGGTEVFTFETGTSISQLETAIDALSDSTGVTASTSGTTLQLISSAYGEEAFVNVRIVSEGAGGTFATAIGTDERDTGTDVAATVNGITALGRGNLLSVNTSVLDLSTSVAAGFTGTVNFTIAGGGALFQLGPDVVSAQQARIGVQSVNTSRLGGVSGLLYQLSSGGSAALDEDANLAASITDQAITQITGLRGRLGAFQKTTLESNLVSLNDTLANLTEAQAEIRDADFAAESARLTRAQILVQSGTAVLAIANSNPQNALSLLR
jgi:flagellin